MIEDTKTIPKQEGSAEFIVNQLAHQWSTQSRRQKGESEMIDFKKRLKCPGYPKFVAHVVRLALVEGNEAHAYSMHLRALPCGKIECKGEEPCQD